MLEYTASIWNGLPQILKNDLQRVQHGCLPVPGAKIEPLELGRTNLTKSAYQRVVESESHPCRRLKSKTAKGQKYDLRSSKLKYALSMSYTKRHGFFFPRPGDIASLSHLGVSTFQITFYLLSFIPKMCLCKVTVSLLL